MRTRSQRRRGAAAVEFAVVAPVILLLFFAAFEFARLHLIRHTVDVAAYEAARRGILPGASADVVREKAKTILRAVGVQQAAIEVQPPQISRATPEVTVHVVVSLKDQSWVPARFLPITAVQGTSTLSREKY